MQFQWRVWHIVLEDQCCSRLIEPGSPAHSSLVLPYRERRKTKNKKTKGRGCTTPRGHCGDFGRMIERRCRGTPSRASCVPLAALLLLYDNYVKIFPLACTCVLFNPFTLQVTAWTFVYFMILA